MEYEFSNTWFANHWNNWLTATKDLTVKNILEVGAFEGQSAARMINHFSALEELFVVSIDTWEGGIEHKHLDMAEIESRFDRNLEKAVCEAPRKVRLLKMKGSSDLELAKLIAQGRSDTFDLVYIDGSHQAADVLTDCVMGYRLCRPGGLIICDDYLWSTEPIGQEELYNMPKLGIDAFSLAFSRKVRQLPLHLYQAYFTKIS